MDIEPETRLEESSIDQIARSVYATMIGLELERCSAPLDSDANSLLAAVQLTGNWIGSVVLSQSPELAQASAAAMLAISPGTVGENDRIDAAAELANMIGGNLKSVLPGPTSLSLPTIVDCRDSNLRVHDARLLHDVAFDSGVGVARVRVYVKIRRAPLEPASAADVLHRVYSQR